MFTVEIKTNLPWQVQKTMINPDQWTVVKQTTSMSDAEKEAAWATHLVQKSGVFTAELSASCRIVNNHKVVWENAIAP